MRLAFDDVPAPHPLTTVALLGLVVVLWLCARVQLLRRRLTRGDGEERGLTRLGFLHSLAAWKGTYALLAIAALAFCALLWWSV